MGCEDRPLRLRPATLPPGEEVGGVPRLRRACRSSVLFSSGKRWRMAGAASRVSTDMSHYRRWGHHNGCSSFPYMPHQCAVRDRALDKARCYKQLRHNGP